MPRDAVKRGLCRHAVSVCLSVRPSSVRFVNFVALWKLIRFQMTTLIMKIQHGGGRRGDFRKMLISPGQTTGNNRKTAFSLPVVDSVCDDYNFLLSQYFHSVPMKFSHSRSDVYFCLIPFLWDSNGYRGNPTILFPLHTSTL